MKKQTELWKMKNGNKIRICDMDDNHLINTIKLLYNNAVRTKEITLSSMACYSGNCNGEMAQDALDSAVTDLELTTDFEFALREYPILENLIEDAKRRELKYEIN